jgi:hypothetical protein
LNERSPDNLCDFTFTINPHPFEIDTFHNNAIRVAHEIVEKHDNVYIMYSGGIDSEYIIKTFVEQKLPFKSILISTPYNRAELAWAVDFYKTYNIKPHVIQYTANELVDNLQRKVLSLGYASLLGVLPLVACDYVNDMNGSIVVGTGEPFTHPVVAASIPLVHDMYEFQFYIEDYDDRHPGAFYLYDLPLQYSMVNDAKYGSDVQKTKCDLYDVKYRKKMYYDKEFFDILNEIKLPVNKQFVRIGDADYRSVLLGNTSVTLK